MNAEDLYSKLRNSLAEAIEKENRQPHLIGVFTGGAWIAERLHADLGLKQPLGYLSSAFHRDDYLERAGPGAVLPGGAKATRIEFEVPGADLIVVDDILYTGRTVRAAMNELFDYGRPARIELAVLVDRGGRELPIFARYCGGLYPLPPDKAYVLTMKTSGEFELRSE